jgi:hypothetical protein
VALRLGVKSLVAPLVVLAGVPALSAPARGAPSTPFREVAGPKDLLYVQSDGVRYAWAKYWRNRVGDDIGVLVFDTLRGRHFRLADPAPGCNFVWIGGGSAVWTCYEPWRVFLTNLSTGRSRAPAGIDRVERDLNQPPAYFCNPAAVGRQWLELSCGGGFGPRSTRYLNHRDGRLTGYLELAEVPFVDLDYFGLFRRSCAPLHRPTGAYAPPQFDYERPFSLQWEGSIRVRRCGTRRVEILSMCLKTDCRSPQLGSDYVTWGEHKRVYAYLPRIRRRLLIGRPPADFVRGRKLSVAHTCNRIFARWGNGIYVARFEPARGAPPCQQRN